MKPLHRRLSDLALGLGFDEEALRQAHKSQHANEQEKAMLARFMRGAESVFDGWALQVLSIKLYKQGVTT
jgi:hypothetical protein